MKNIMITLVMLFTAVSPVAAQQTAKAVISTPGAHCVYCKERIEAYVSRQYGVSSVKVDIKKKTTTVTWIKDRTNIEEIKVHIANRGYDADDVTAEPTMYSRLPPACQYKPAAKDSTAIKP
jgi:copper chaperone CopZ